MLAPTPKMYSATLIEDDGRKTANLTIPVNPRYLALGDDGTPGQVTLRGGDDPTELADAPGMDTKRMYRRVGSSVTAQDEHGNLIHGTFYERLW